MTEIIVIDSEESLSLLIAESLSRSFSVRFYNMNSMYLSGEGMQCTCGVPIRSMGL